MGIIRVEKAASVSYSADALDQGPNVKQKAPDADSAGNKFQVRSASVVRIVKASPKERGLLQKTHQDLCQ